MPRQTRNFRLQERTSCDLIGAFDNKVPFKDVAFATEETISLKAVADFDYEFLRVSALAESITGSSVHMTLHLQGDRRITTRRPEERSCAAMASCNPFVCIISANHSAHVGLFPHKMQDGVADSFGDFYELRFGCYSQKHCSIARSRAGHHLAGAGCVLSQCLELLSCVSILGQTRGGGGPSHTRVW